MNYQQGSITNLPKQQTLLKAMFGIQEEDLGNLST